MAGADANMFHILVPTVLLAINAVSLCDSASNVTKLYLMGLYPFGGTTWVGGPAMSLATEMAFRDINANPDILPDYELNLVPTDSSCEGGIATDSMYREIYNRTTTKIIILGPGCSLAAEPTAQAVHHWNLVQITTATSPLLSNRNQFPLLFRILPSESKNNVVKFAMFREFHWTKIATLHQSVPLFSLPAADMHRDAKELGIEIIITESFVDNPGIAVENIKNAGARIIVGGFYSDMARKVFCEAYKQNMYGAKYVWIITGWLESEWWRTPDDTIDCSLAQMDEVTTKYFGVYIDSFPSDDTRRPSLSGLTTTQFLEEFKAFSGLENPKSLVGYTEISVVYDMAWTAAMALHEAQRKLSELDASMSLADFAYDEVIGNIIFDIISNILFEGVSGPVKFDEEGDRLGLLELLQLQDDSFLSVGIVDPFVGTGRDISWEGRDQIIWQGGAPPIDFIIEREDRQTIQLPVFIAGSIFAFLGIAIACCFLAFNIHFRKIRVIKMSSPNINNLMLIGGILSYVSVIVFGIDTNITSAETFVGMCKTKTWCLSIGFSMAFGSMFSKTWRVHKIFTNKTAMKTVVKDKWLFGCVMALVLIDVLILIVWEVVDPVMAVEQIGSKVVDEENDDIFYIPIRMMCESANQIYFIGAFYVIDGLLLIFGAFLAWETRKVSIPALNDSKYIGVCVYNVLILSFVGALVSFVVEERNVHYTLVATLIWLATTFTLCVVFVPKIRMRNDVRPTQNTMITAATTLNTPNNISDDLQKEIGLLRQEILQWKKKCSDQEEEIKKLQTTKNSPEVAVTEVLNGSPRTAQESAMTP